MVLRKTLYSLCAVIVLLGMTGCGASAETAEAFVDTVKVDDSASDETERPEGWTEETHGDEVDPNFDVVFPQDKVNRLDLTISAENWDAMLADMTELYGEFGQGGGMGGGRPGGLPGNAPQGDRGEPLEAERQDGAQPMPPANRPLNNGQPGMGGNISDGVENPIWVTATVAFEENTWENVGIRFKGNSSLKSAWSSGNYKLPFKLDFDQFEDDYPEIDDQRFYGFKQLSLASNFNDDSYLREKVTADIFRAFGVPSAQTAFYEVYVDYGEGPVYFGLYTMVEMVEDTVISEQFTSDAGNLYKPDGSGATFAAGSFTEASFDKETNQDEDDYSDILAVLDALHADTRLGDPSTWRSGLETVFDVDTFLRWLAVNTVVQNWDTYGLMSHNYFLYTDPETDQVTWIPWDNNHALSGTGMREALSLGLDEVTDQWPLIRYLMDDPVYRAQYDAYVGAVVETVFVPEEMAQTYQAYHELIGESALAETEEATMLRSAADFENSVHSLIQQVNGRYEAVQDYLNR
ncbi:MAG: CotH kinase family protein [Chloroflexota bacterium]|nr:CotH kinase family protein [Chloroflexota bacterium]